MVTHMFLKNKEYYCYNCKMKQQGTPAYCSFCGYYFSNFEEIIEKELINDNMDQVEDLKNESNLCRKS